jgi:excisionase family DNA binding protein
VIVEYESAEEAARRWGVSARWVQALCHSRRIPGAQRLGRVWLIPRGAGKPTDLRVTLHWGKSRAREKQ